MLEIGVEPTERAGLGLVIPPFTEVVGFAMAVPVVVEWPGWPRVGTDFKVRP